MADSGGEDDFVGYVERRGGDDEPFDNEEDGEDGEEDQFEGEEEGEEEEVEGEGEEEGEEVAEGEDEEGVEESEAPESDVVAVGIPDFTSPAKLSGVSRPTKHRRQRKLTSLLLSKYDAVWHTTEVLGWTAYAADQEDQCKSTYNVCWSDTSVALERIMKMGRLQKINHYPGMLELVRKAGTARNLNKMLKAVGKEYKFFPKTFMLPADYTELKKEWEPGKNHGNKTFIVKPSKGCQGTGIRLTRCLDEISPHEPNIVQRYLHRPHLLDGYKYDLRLYVLLSSLNPLRIFLFREGLVRVCTQKYHAVEKNMSDVRMHLTNYAINKDSEAFVQPEDEENCDDSHKRTISSLMRTLADEGHDTQALWTAIGEVCVKTIISVQPHLEHTYFTCRRRSEDAGFGCFELLGFDIMMDHKMRPFLLEVNHSPSFTCDSALDASVKQAVLRSTMEMVSFSKDEWKLMRRHKKRMTPELREHLVGLRDEYETANCDRLGFDTLYPPNAQTTGGDEVMAAEMRERYDSHLAVATELYSNMSLTGSRRQTNNCGSKGVNPALSGNRQNSGSVGTKATFHAAALAAKVKAGSARKA